MISTTLFSVKGTKGACDRKVPIQPLYFLGEDKKITRYNLRKLNETPYHLIRSNRFDELYKEVLFNFRWLHAKINCMPLQVGKHFPRFRMWTFAKESTRTLIAIHCCLSYQVCVILIVFLREALLCTVVPVMNGHPRDQANVSVHDRWPHNRVTGGRVGGGRQTYAYYQLHY